MSINDEKESGKKRTTIVLSEAVLEIGQGLATADRRSFSNYLEVLIARDARLNGANLQTEGAGGVARAA